MVFSFILCHGLSFTDNFPFPLRTLPDPKAQKPSTQAKLCDRQILRSLAGCGKMALHSAASRPPIAVEA